MKIVRNLIAASVILGVSASAAPVFAADSLNPQTRKNLETAMHGEAFAHLKYLAFSERARKSGHPEIAKLFQDNSDVEAYEHFAREADALKLVQSDKANLLDSMAAEHYENTKMYVDFAKQAEAVGDKKVAALFHQIAADEGDHYALYKAALEKLRATSE